MAEYALMQGRKGALDVLVIGGEVGLASELARMLSRQNLRVGVARLIAEPKQAMLVPRSCRVTLILPSAARDPDAFTGGLLAALCESPASVLVPLDRAVSSALARNGHLFAQETAVAQPSQESVEMVNDRVALYTLASALQIPVPDGVTVQDPTQLAAAAVRIGFPAAVRPTLAGEPIPRPVPVHDLSELETAGRDRLAMGTSLLVQPWLPGPSETVAVFVADGMVHSRFAHVTKRALASGNGRAIYTESIPPPRVITACAERLVTSAGVDGYAEVHFRRGSSGERLLTSAGTLMSHTVLAAEAAGVDFAHLAFLRSTQQDLPRPDGYEPGVRMRWVGGELRRVLHALAGGEYPETPRFAEALRDLVGAGFRHTHYDDRRVLGLRPCWRGQVLQRGGSLDTGKSHPRAAS